MFIIVYDVRIVHNYNSIQNIYFDVVKEAFRFSVAEPLPTSSL